MQKKKEACIQLVTMSDGTSGIRIIFKTYKIAEVTQESQNAVVILFQKGAA